MSIFIDNESLELFSKNGFSENDIGETINTYRKQGLSDDDIQSKIDDRLNSWKQPTDNRTVLQGGVEKKVDLRPHAIIDNIVDRGAAAISTPFNMLIKKNDLQTAYNEELQSSKDFRAEQAKKHPILTNLDNGLMDLAGYAVLPAARLFKGAGLLSKVGNAALTGGYQGGVIGGIDSLANKGDFLSGAAEGAAVGGALGGAFPLVGGAFNKVKKVVPLVISKKTGLEPEVLEQAVQPDSKALGLMFKRTKELDAYKNDIAEQIRDNYDQLLNKKGEVLENAVENLPTTKESLIDPVDVLTDISDVFYQKEYTGTATNNAIENTGDFYKSLRDDIKKYTIRHNAPNILINKDNGVITGKRYSDYIDYYKDREVKDLIIKNKPNTGNDKKDIFSSIFGENRTPIKLTNLNDKKNVNLSSSSTKKMINTAYRNIYEQIENLGLPKEEKQKILNDSLDIVSNVKDIYKNAIPILSHGDLKGVKGRTITRYALPVSKDGNRYNVMLTVKNDKLDDIGILYDLKSNKKPLDRKSLDVSSRSQEANIPLKVSSTPSNDDLLHLQGNNTSITDLVDFVNSNLEKYKPGEEYLDKIAPIDLQRWKQAQGKKINFDNTESSPKLREELLKQIYGRTVNRLNPLSEELAEANKNYAYLKGFEKREGTKNIFRPGDNIDTASRALKNYDRLMNNRNKAKNVQELEDILTANGYSPFRNTINDIDAALALNLNLNTGRNYGGLNAFERWAAALGLAGQRALNRRPYLAELYKQLALSNNPELRIPLIYTLEDTIFEDDE